jgi:hypothetical protein
MFAYIDVLKEDGNLSNSIFSSHLDTVEHEIHGSTVKEQGLILSSSNVITVKGGGILGADDGAGVWLLVNMIDANVPGRYFFFAGEESGGIGSSFAVRTYPNLFKGFDRAVAFDRRGTGDVIVSQCVGDCASPLFGVTLADLLSCETYKFDVTHGVYTDTAEMIGLVPECVNISCGYYNEHSPSESLDLTFLQSLLRKVIELDWDKLPTVRVPKAKRDLSWGSKNTYLDEYDFNSDADIDEVLDLMQLNGVTISDLLTVIKDNNMVDLL